jgi:hypothetical protein
MTYHRSFTIALVLLSLCVTPTRADTEPRRSGIIHGLRISQALAERVCAHAPEFYRDFCVEDVLATNDIDMAMAYTIPM